MNVSDKIYVGCALVKCVPYCRSVSGSTYLNLSRFKCVKRGRACYYSSVSTLIFYTFHYEGRTGTLDTFICRVNVDRI